MAGLRRCCRPRMLTLVVLGIAMAIITLFSFFGTPVTHMRQFAREDNVPELVVPRDQYFDDVRGTPQPPTNLSAYLKCVDLEGKGYVQDTLCMKRPNYLPTYKNPCWIDWTEQLQRLRCLPYFHLLGVDKSGTTDLHSRIAQHPHVLLNSGGLGKETYYWCWLKYGLWMRKYTTPKPFFNYLRLFDKPAATIAENVDPNGYHPLITGDGTPMDFWDFRGWTLIPQNKGLKEPVVLTPHLMRHLYANPKFIIILRNPVD
ncbi:hypothetical protein BaRGS_00020487, partial [Batillaria attramentaria]